MSLSRTLSDCLAADFSDWVENMVCEPGRRAFGRGTIS